MSRKSTSPASLSALLCWLTIAVGCSGDGCSCASPIPGGFPSADRTPNAMQVRLTPTGIDKVEADPAGLVGAFIGDTMGGNPTFDVSSACDPSSDPRVCCDSGGNPVVPCGPLEIDLVARAGDLPRLVVTPVAGQSRINVTVRARLRTLMDIPITAFGLNCGVKVDTAGGTPDDIRLELALTLPQDQVMGTTRIEVASVTVSDLSQDDVTLTGNFTCQLASFGLGFFLDSLIGTIEDQIRSTLTDVGCKSCTTLADCAGGADECSGGVCVRGGSCVQEIGISGRLVGQEVLGSFSPGTTGAIDMYEVAGGYATTESDGAALGFLGGFRSGGTERDRCGPSATPPAKVTINQSTYFQGNIRPDTSAPFDIGIGIHKQNLAEVAWAAYEGGFLCLNIGTRAVSLLNTDTLAILMPSVVELMHGTVGQIVLALRPQAPPQIVLGLGTFIDDGNGGKTIDEPLLDVTFPSLEIDVFTMVDDQFVRVMTLVTDVHLPLNLDANADGELVPILGELDDAFTNLSVKNSEALIETPAELADKFPAVLSLALPFLAEGLGSFALPELGSLRIAIQEGGITSVDNKEFLAIFADLAPVTTMMAPVQTSVAVAGTSIPAGEVFQAAGWDQAVRPRIELILGASAADSSAQAFEYSFRVDGGLWSPYTTSTRVSISRQSLWLQGRHVIETRARVVGHPESADRSPARTEFIIDTIAPRTFVSRPDRETVGLIATDNVSRGALTARYWFAGSDPITISLPAVIDLDGRPAEDLHFEVTDEAGNSTISGAEVQVIGFHGTPAEGGCGCATSGPGPSAGGLILFALVALGLFGRRRRRGLSWLELAGVRRAASLRGLLGAGGLAALLFVPGCSCGSSAATCAGGECLPGEVERGPTGRFSDVAASSTRTVVSAYDEGLGDLVLIDLTSEPYVYVAVDGIPQGELPSYDPETYRGGQTNPGPNVGAHTSVALHEDRARIAYQDIDNGFMKYAAEYQDRWEIHVIDRASEGGTAGLHSSVAVGADGTPRVAYLVTGVPDGQGGVKSQLKVATASSPNPLGADDWSIEILDEALGTCAGACTAPAVCIAEAMGERCVMPSGTCAGGCGDTDACINGVCEAFVPDPSAYDLPTGTGLFTNLLMMPDGRPVVVYYDRDAGNLAMQVGGSSWGRIILDAASASDTGMFAGATVDGTGVVHVVYQDAMSDRLLYVSWNGSTVSEVEVVDDGARSESRTHNVGASAEVVVASGVVRAFYQDGLLSDLVSATRGAGGAWTHEDLRTGVDLDGFFVSAATAGSAVTVTSYAYDRAVFPPGILRVDRISQ